MLLKSNMCTALLQSIIYHKHELLRQLIRIVYNSECAFQQAHSSDIPVLSVLDSPIPRFPIPCFKDSLQYPT